MDSENAVDFSAEMGYNNTNDENVTIVKMDEQRPINEPECPHDDLVPDPDDSIGDAIFHGCANPKCGRGWYIRT